MRLDSGLREKLEKIAKRDDRSIAYVVRKAVEEFVKREGK
jgi:predicted transcriptional regulator